MPSTKQQRYLGAHGLLVHRRTSKKVLDSLKASHTNAFGEFEHKNRRNNYRTERIPLSEVFPLKNGNYILKGISPHDGKPLTKIIHHS